MFFLYLYECSIIVSYRDHELQLKQLHWIEFTIVVRTNVLT